jgi:beta-galactosidase
MPVLDLIGAKIKFYDTLPAPNVGHVEAGGQSHAWSTWGDVLEPRDNQTVALARYSDQYYAGGIAATTRKLGKGSVTYIGADSQAGELEAQLVRDEFTRAGVAVENFPDGFSVDFRDGLWIATNFTEKPVDAPVPSGAKILMGAASVPIAGVTVWR